MRPGRVQRGFALLAALATVAVVAAATTMVVERWADLAQRDREDDLLRVGAAYAHAIERYREASPGNVKAYPRELDDLTLDVRFIGGVRHLRKLYADPLQPQRPWGIVRAADGTVRGVYSTDSRAPWRRTPIVIGSVSLPAAARYSDWKFVPAAP